ncbi:Bacteriophage head to tail connecting protein [Azospirillum oryzae]|uniref:Bacteriophage head to tail connecting protein n=1 Tax=Azospirillum oryzae TaxID=286727 RepID=A0A1X7HEW1_9PROT|nr:portal protein [Azospirillum oryzae]SMF84340.1 Bacteriophage head to tail connecting protein [Azospirillum oryzae]
MPASATVKPPARRSKELSEPEALLERYRAARERRRVWESHWQECYDHALPNGRPFRSGGTPGERRVDRLFDGTAPDAVEQLAASLLSELTPPWSRWFGFQPGPTLTGSERDRVAPLLDRAAGIVQAHFDRSNFAVEIHQAFLDLVTVGTASLLMEEAAPGAPSSLRFTAVPLAEAVLEEGPDGRLDATFRRSEATLAQILQRFPGADLPDELRKQAAEDPDSRFPLVEAVLPDGAAYRWGVVLDSGLAEPSWLAQGRFAQSPFVNFRWLKAPGETYGRSPVMKALPDIKTANKVVELVLKNASIAVTGIWQADDDGVLNPTTIRLVPGTIIPKAVGSAGLTPLANPGRFDVSQLVLDDLRVRIRHALLVDRLGPVESARMTATEVLERSVEMARLLGATYGRLQAELMTPLVLRAVSILRRRGEIPDITVDGRLVELQHRSPLAQAQAQRDVQAALRWLDSVKALGPEAEATVDAAATAHWLGEAFGVPAKLMRAEVAAPVAAPLVTPPASPAAAADAGASNG